MPQNKVQGIVFGWMMSYTMAYGMEVYNTAINQAFNLNVGGFTTMTNGVFWDAFLEALYMGLFVEIISSLVGNKMGTRFMLKYTNPEKDNPYFVRLMRQAGTVAFMCPAMSLVASILFSVILAGRPVYELPAIWVGTFLKNFPMAFFWNMFAAAPFCHWVFDIYNGRMAAKQNHTLSDIH